MAQKSALTPQEQSNRGVHLIFSPAGWMAFVGSPFSESTVMAPGDVAMGDALILSLLALSRRRPFSLGPWINVWKCSGPPLPPRFYGGRLGFLLCDRFSPKLAFDLPQNTCKGDFVLVFFEPTVQSFFFPSVSVSIQLIEIRNALSLPPLPSST